jgi:hypothetical protein
LAFFLVRLFALDPRVLLGLIVLFLFRFIGSALVAFSVAVLARQPVLVRSSSLVFVR